MRLPIFGWVVNRHLRNIFFRAAFLRLFSINRLGRLYLFGSDFGWIREEILWRSVCLPSDEVLESLLAQRRLIGNIDTLLSDHDIFDPFWHFSCIKGLCFENRIQSLGILKDNLFVLFLLFYRFFFGGFSFRLLLLFYWRLLWNYLIFRQTIRANIFKVIHIIYLVYV